MKDAYTNKPLRILIFDIESAPNVSYTWGKWEQNVVQFKKEWYMLCFAYKWLGEKKIHVVSLRQFQRYKRDPENDIEVIKALHALFNEADVIVAHNGNSFDIKMAQTKFMMHKLPVPKPFKTVDTKLVAKRYGRFMSNSLDDLGNNLGLGRKVKHPGFDMWLGCMAGDTKSWEMMERYNKQDVNLLEQVYLELRGYMSNHPKSYTGQSCDVCESGNIIYRGYMQTKRGTSHRYQCKDCGTWGVEKFGKQLTKHI